jgi:hypothetical protein
MEMGLYEAAVQPGIRPNIQLQILFYHHNVTGGSKLPFPFEQ